MLECFDGYFALSSLDSVSVTDGGYYLTSHEHITRELARACTDDEFTDGISFFDKAYVAAKREFMNDFNAALPNYFDAAFVVESAQVGETVEPKEVIAAGPAGQLDGILISTMNSRWLGLSVPWVKIYRETADEDTIFIYDATTGDLLHEQDYTPEAGKWNIVQIQKTFNISGQTKEFFICHASDVDSHLKTRIRTGWWNECGCGDHYGTTFTVRGATGTGTTKEDLTLSQYTHGLIVNFSLVCSREQIILNNAELFRPAFFTKLVIEFLKLVGASDKINRSTLNYDQGKVNEIIYGVSNGRFGEGTAVPGLQKKYETNLSTICQGIQRDTSDRVCFECKSTVTYREVIP